MSFPLYQVLHVEQEMNDIAVLHDIFFALGAHFARFFGLRLATQRDKVVVCNHLGADEAAFEIGVDDTGSLRCGVAFVDGPRTYFLHAGGEISLQAEQIVARADKAVQAGFLHAHFC